jgi:hypothetical protein
MERRRTKWFAMNQQADKEAKNTISRGLKICADQLCHGVGGV